MRASDEMSGNNDSTVDRERQQILTHLLDAVKQCQVRFGGRHELATETDSRVSCICAVWESALQHGMKHNNKALSTFKQVTELTGLTKMKGVFGEIKNLETEPVFWHYVKELLTKHEQERFYMLKHINTDGGRGRAWLRSVLNEHSLERYMHVITESSLLSQYYEEWAFLRNQERSSMLPMMAAGLNSILFAINIDNEVYNSIRPAEGIQLGALLNSATSSSRTSRDEPQPVIGGSEASNDKKRDQRKKKKKLANVISFEDDEAKQGVASSSSSPPPSTGAIEISHGARTSPASPKLGASRKNEPAFIHLHREESRVSLAGSCGSLDDDMDEMVLTDKPPCDLTPLSAGPSVCLPDDVQSVDSYDLPSYSNSDVDSASYALSRTKQASSPGYRTQGDGMTFPDAVKQDSMSTGDLKQAVVAMMLRKDEVEEENKSIRTALEQEVELSTGLRLEVQQMTEAHKRQQEASAEKVNALSRENELLKQQLKKYVNAVQLLRQNKCVGDVSLGIQLEDVQPAIPQQVTSVDLSEEASAFEQKLVQVAEMHGELIEFNEHLQRLLSSRENMIKRLRQELVELRGPLPQTNSAHEDAVSVASSDTTSSSVSPLINVWIPSAFLRGSGTEGYHVYQIYLRIREEEWNVYRRYAQFYEFHRKQKKKFPLLNTFDFPPKKTIGNKDNKFVEARRKKLQLYLRNVINHLVQNNSDLLNGASKQALLDCLPFFGDSSVSDRDNRRKSRTNSQLSSSPAQLGTSPRHYTGL